MPRARRKKRSRPSLIAGHLRGIKRALLEGEKRSAFLEFLKQNLPAKQGIYTLYDERGLYYAGKASDLAKRLNQHLRDRHGESWDRMALFHVADSANVGELEGLVVATARPPGNRQKPKASVVAVVACLVPAAFLLALATRRGRIKPLSVGVRWRGRARAALPPR